MKQKVRNILKAMEEIEIIQDSNVNDIGYKTEEFGDNPGLRVEAGGNQRNGYKESSSFGY